MKIRIGFCDFSSDFDVYDNYWLKTLRSMYGDNGVEIVKNPDYLFYSCFGFEHLKYDCIKIFYTGENLVPDFNLCDYAIGFHEISFNDRYLRMPLYQMYNKAYEKAICKNNYGDSFYLNRKFCCSIISNSMANPARVQMLDLLDQYKKVDNGGKYRNNVGGCVKDKLKFESNYKFVLCFENSSTIGYTTEKLLEGFAGGGIPIYWGNPNVEREFNSKSFVNCNRFGSLQEALSYIKKLDKDDKKYLEMVRENIFGNGGESGRHEFIQKNVESFLHNIFIQNYTDAFRICNESKAKTYILSMKRFRIAFEVDRFGQRFKVFVKNNLNCMSNNSRIN